MPSLELSLRLMRADPAPWRIVRLHDSATFLDLHEAIQDASDSWQDCHLWDFKEWVGDQRRRPALVAALKTEDGTACDDLRDAPDAASVKLSFHFKAVGDRALYNYDYGDNWEVEVRLARVDPSEDPGRRLLAGALAFPPEDCGGPGGYENCCALADKTWAATEDARLEVKHMDKAEKKDMLSWLDGWTPRGFDLEDIREGFDGADEKDEEMGEAIFLASRNPEDWMAGTKESMGPDWMMFQAIAAHARRMTREWRAKFGTPEAFPRLWEEWEAGLLLMLSDAFDCGLIFGRDHSNAWAAALTCALRKANGMERSARGGLPVPPLKSVKAAADESQLTDNMLRCRLKKIVEELDVTEGDPRFVLPSVMAADRSWAADKHLRIDERIALYDQGGLEAVKARAAQDLLWIDGRLERLGH